MKEFYVHGGPELRGEHIFPNGLVGSFGAGAEAIYYHASLSANQAFVYPICSAAIQMVSGFGKRQQEQADLGCVGLWRALVSCQRQGVDLIQTHV